MTRPNQSRQRVRIEVPLLLSITLDGEPAERSSAYVAFLEDAVETVERLGRRYYLREHDGESVTARLPEECDITDLGPGPTPAPQVTPGSAGAGGRTRAHSPGFKRGLSTQRAKPHDGAVAAGPDLRVIRGAPKRDQRANQSARCSPG